MRLMLTKKCSMIECGCNIKDAKVFLKLAYDYAQENYFAEN